MHGHANCRLGERGRQVSGAHADRRSLGDLQNAVRISATSKFTLSRGTCAARALLLAGVALIIITVAHAQVIVAHTTLSNFGGGPADGSIRGGSTWAGQVTQNTGSITVGGTARDDNGWGDTGLSLDASAFGYLNIVAQRNPGHAASSLFVQFEDRFLNTYIVSVDATVFTLDAPNLVQIALGVWPSGFDPTQITGWNIGGGGLGTTDFRMTLDSLEFTTSAIPEPTSAAIVGSAVFALVLLRRLGKRRRSSLG